MKIKIVNHLSLRSPERGLKYRLFKILILFSSVAPFAGAWIEIPANCTTGWNYNVAPFAGAWIEIVGFPIAMCVYTVAPFTGAWIEICFEFVRC